MLNYFFLSFFVKNVFAGRLNSFAPMLWHRTLLMWHASNVCNRARNRLIINNNILLPIPFGILLSQLHVMLFLVTLFYLKLLIIFILHKTTKILKISLLKQMPLHTKTYYHSQKKLLLSFKKLMAPCKKLMPRPKSY